ncbi:hypothetical protein [Streptomyces sannanensis]
MNPVIRNRVASVLVAGATAGALLAGGATSAVASTPPSESPSLSDFSDCPDLPTGVDPAKWRCEVFVSEGRFKLGAVDVPAMAPMVITNAEGPLPDGSRGQVFGALRATPTPVPDAPAPFRGSLRLQPEYAGYADFYGDGVHRGALDLKFRLIHPLLDSDCTIGSDADPVKFRMIQDGSTEWVSKNPPVLKFKAHDTAFAAPGAHGCGPLTHLVDQRLGLPAATGDNEISLNASYTFRTYDKLPARS